MTMMMMRCCVHSVKLSLAVECKVHLLTQSCMAMLASEAHFAVWNLLSSSEEASLWSSVLHHLARELSTRPSETPPRNSHPQLSGNRVSLKDPAASAKLLQAVPSSYDTSHQPLLYDHGVESRSQSPSCSACSKAAHFDPPRKPIFANLSIQQNFHRMMQVCLFEI